MQTLLRNCRLIPALSGGWDNGLADVLLNGETIAGIFPAGSGIRADSERNCQGKTLMPGLFDLHMHINWAYHKGELRLDDFKIFIESCLSARLYLDNGITTVRDLAAPGGCPALCVTPLLRVFLPGRAFCAADSSSRRSAAPQNLTCITSCALFRAATA